MKTSLFSEPFRPFFLLASLSAFLSPMFFVCFLVSDYTYYGHYFDVLDWHAFEMIFGFISVLMSGFILTAGAHWANRKSYHGLPLIILTFFWILERLVFSFPIFSHQTTFILGLPFYLIFLPLLFNLLKENKPQAILLTLFFSLFFVSKIFYLLGPLINNQSYLDWGKEISLALIKIIISIVAGRIIPFIFNKRILNAQLTKNTVLNFACNISLIVLIPLNYLFNDENIISIAYLLAAVIHTIRWASWKPHKTQPEPILFVLIIGYLFLILHLLATSASFFFESLQYGQSSLHLFTTGCVGLLSIGIMTRVSLAHTNRPIEADSLIKIMFLTVLLGAIFRVLIPIITPENHYDWLHFSMGIWTLGFVIYFFKFIKIHCSRTPEV